MSKKISSSPIKPGFSLLETLMAIGIASIVMTSALSVVASIHYSQKRLQFAQDFYAEGRYLMERISQTIRNNTIDYDYFFETLGPPSGGTDCSNFDALQNSTGALLANNAANRMSEGYESIFFWDTNGDGSQNRNLGGKDTSGTEDPCAFAWDNTTDITTLYLINASRNLRTAVAFVDSDDVGTDPDDVEIRQQLTADLDDDGRGDIWAPYDVNGDGTFDPADGDIDIAWDSASSVCEIIYDADSSDSYDLDEYFAVMGEAGDQDFCEQAYDFTSIAPPAIKVNDLTFRPAPSQDPFLAFRVDTAQVHPHVFMYLDLELDNPSRYGFDTTDKPSVSFQTTVGSRVFGNIRR